MTTSKVAKAQMVREPHQNPEALCQKREKRLFRSGTEMVCKGTRNSPFSKRAHARDQFGESVTGMPQKWCVIS